MMQGMMNAMRLQSMLAGEGRVSTRLGTVRGYNSADYCAKVMIQPENIETGWLPIASPWVGNGWGMFSPPTDGDVVMVTFQEDDFTAGIISMRLFNDGARPLNVPGGEFWLAHKSGSLLKFHNDGSVELTAAAGLVIKAASLKLQNAGTALLNLLNSAFASWAQNHVHTSAAPGSPTSAPTVAPAANTQTSIVQAE